MSQQLVWQKALQILTNSAAAAAASSSTAVSSSSSSISAAALSNQNKKSTSSVSNSNDENQHQTIAAQSIVSKWLKDNISTNPTVSSKVAVEVSKSISTAGNNNNSNNSNNKVLKNTLIGVAMMNDSSNNNIGLKQSNEIASNLLAVVDDSNNISQISTDREKLQLLSAVSKTSWNNGNSIQNIDNASGNSVEESFRRRSNLLATTTRKTSSTSSPARELFQALSTASSSKSEETKNAAAALYTRFLAPAFLSSLSSSSTHENNNKKKKQKRKTPTSTTNNYLTETIENELPSEYRDFLYLSKQSLENQENIPALFQSLKNLPQQRPVNSIYGKVLLKHGKWNDALRFFSETSSKKQQQWKGLETTIAGIYAHLAITENNNTNNNWKNCLKVISEIPNEKTKLSFIRHLFSSSSSSTNDSIASMMDNKNDNINDEINSIQKMLQNYISRTAADVTGTSPQNEIEAKNAGAAHALALAVSSSSIGWRQALLDFSLIATTPTTSSVSSNNNTTNNDTHDNYHFLAQDVVEETLKFDKRAKNLVLKNAAIGGNIDVLKMSLRLLGVNSDNNINNNVNETNENEMKKKKTTFFFSNKEATNLIQLLSQELKDTNTLRGLRESWPTLFSSKLAIKAETRLRADWLMSISSSLSQKSSSNNLSKSQILQQKQQQQKLFAKERLTATNYLDCLNICVGSQQHQKEKEKEEEKTVLLTKKDVLALRLIETKHPQILSAVASKVVVSQYEKIKRRIKCRKEIMEEISSSSSFEKNVSSFVGNREVFIEKFLDAQFPPDVAADLLVKMNQLDLNSSSSSSSSQNKKEKQNSSTPTFWNKFANELIRLSRIPKNNNNMKRTVAPTLLVSLVQTNNVSTNNINATTYCNLISVLEERCQKLESKKLLFLKTENNKNDNNKEIRREKQKLKELSRCVLRLIAREEKHQQSGENSSTSSSSLLFPNQEEKRFALSLTQSISFPTQIFGNSNKKQQQGLRDEIRAKIVLDASREATSSSSSSSTFIIDKNENKNKNIKKKSFQIMLPEQQPFHVQPGWVGGARDVLKTVSLQKSSSSSSSQETTTNFILNDNNTDNNNNALDNQSLLWLLQQSDECRNFVQNETRRIMAARNNNKSNISSSSSGGGVLAKTTISTELWKQLCRLFRDASSCYSATSSSSSSDASLIVTDNDDNNDDKEKTKKKKEQEILLASLRFVETCADVLTSSHLSLADGTVPFCLHSFSLHSTKDKDKVDDDEITRRTLQQKEQLQKCFVLHACHLEDCRARVKFLATLCHAVSTSEKGQQEEGNVKHETSENKSDELNQRLKMLVAAEGFGDV